VFFFSFPKLGFTVSVIGCFGDQLLVFAIGTYAELRSFFPPFFRYSYKIQLEEQRLVISNPGAGL
jgi:hypothetical protein